MDDNWKTVKMQFGKYRNDTIYNILLNDYKYIEWLDDLDLQTDVRNAVNSAIEYHNKHFTE